MGALKNHFSGGKPLFNTGRNMRSLELEDNKEDLLRVELTGE